MENPSLLGPLQRGLTSASGDYHEPGSIQQLVSGSESTEKNHTQLSPGSVAAPLGDTLRALVNPKAGTVTRSQNVSATIRVAGTFRPRRMGHLKLKKFGNPILKECQDALNHIARVSLKSGLLSSWTAEFKKKKGWGRDVAAAQLSTYTASIWGGGGTSAPRTPPYPRNVRLVQCDARRPLERKLRKFSACSIAVCLLIIQSSSQRTMTSPQFAGHILQIPKDRETLSCLLQAPGTLGTIGRARQTAKQLYKHRSVSRLVRLITDVSVLRNVA